MAIIYLPAVNIHGTGIIISLNNCCILVLTQYSVGLSAKHIEVTRVVLQLCK